MFLSRKDRNRLAHALNGNTAVEFFHPTSYDTNRIDGVFVMDSFYYMKKRNGKKHLYLRSVLDELQASTGYTFVAVCSGGAAMAHPCGGAASFAEMLEHVPTGVRFVVPIVCGNDCYGHRVHPVTPAMEIAIAEYCARVPEPCVCSLGCHWHAFRCVGLQDLDERGQLATV